jgi:tetratricopeptide (TPR) repeat protein
LAFRRSLGHMNIWLVLILVGLTSASGNALALEGEGGSSPAAAVGGVADHPRLTEDGPAVSAPSEVAQERVIASWRSAKAAPYARAAALRRTRLEFGLGNLPSPGAIVASAATEEDPEIFSEMAVGLAPNIPSFQVDHGFALWRSGDIGGSILALLSAGWITATHLSPQLWIIGNFSLLLMLVFISASLGFFLISALRIFPDAAHDLGDLFSDKMPTFARYAALAALLISPLVFGEGVAGLALALFFVAFAYGALRQRSALVMAAMFLMIGILPVAQVVSVATRLVDQDPVAKSVLAVLAGTESLSDVERLERATSEESIAAHALAYRARRYGLTEESSQRLDSIIERHPGDAIALTNRGNIELRRGYVESAIGFYERAVAQAGSPTLLFNLSQAYAIAFRMEEYEATLSWAQLLGDKPVAELSRLGDARLVADLEFPVSMLRDRFVSRALDHSSDRGLVLEAFAPGWLGARWQVLAGAFGLAALVSLLVAGRWAHASSCSRCGHRICTRCEETVCSEEICEDCRYLFQYSEATDPSLRMARLQALSKRESRIGRIVLALSLGVPGVAGFAARRPDLSLLALLLFGWVAAWITWPSGIFADPLLMGRASVIFFAVPGVLALLAYASVVALSLVLRKTR